MAKQAPNKQKKQLIVLGALCVVAVVMVAKLLVKSQPQSAKASATITAIAPAVTPGNAHATASEPLRPLVVDWAVESSRDPFDIGKLLPASPKPAEQIAANAHASKPAETRKPDADALRKQALSQMHIQGMITGGEPRVVINGQMYGLGEVVNGFTVRQIASRRIVLEKDGIEIVIEM